MLNKLTKYAKAQQIKKVADRTVDLYGELPLGVNSAVKSVIKTKEIGQLEEQFQKEEYSWITF
jgi:hypothetical protein